jgi:hypothetical protein
VSQTSQKNRQGVLCTDTEDFSRWTWPVDPDAISVAAAQLVMKEAANTAHGYEATVDGRFAITMAIFEGEVEFSVKLLDVVDEWLTSNKSHRDGSHPFADDDRARTEIMLADLEEAARRVRAALDR